MSETPNPVSLGSPIADEWARLLLAVDDLKRAFHVAQMEGNIDARERAAFAQCEAMDKLAAFEHRHASDFLLIVRFVRKLFPGRLEELIDPHHRNELDNTQEAIREALNRIEDVEDAQVEMEVKGVTA